jgi:hypothetical protein
MNEVLEGQKQLLIASIREGKFKAPHSALFSEGWGRVIREYVIRALYSIYNYCQIDLQF